MFQELLLADLVVADLTIDNPNVWYELGIRHALRARGAISIAARDDPMPFDVYSDRKLRYHLGQGVPDPNFLEKDRSALAAMARATLSAWYGRKSSPVYNLLQNLQEPEWKTLRSHQEIWEKQADWERRVATARAKRRAGDVVILAEEAPAQVLRREAHLIAARTLRSLEQFAFALEQVEQALALEPPDLESRREKGLLLGRLGRFDEAREWLKQLARDHPRDAETCAHLGRVEKDAWASTWRDLADAEKAEAARREIYQLREATGAYTAGFRNNPCHYYSGINAVTLLHVDCFLSGVDKDAMERMAMEGAVRWAAHAELARETGDQKNFWARATLADLEVLLNDKQAVEDAYRFAVAAADKDWFALNSSWQQLSMLKALGFRPEETGAGISVLQQALDRVSPPWRPDKVLLFSGHMIDTADRSTERFPASMQDLAASAIASKLDELEGGKNDLALCEGACGGDLLFAEAALALGMRLELRLPFSEPKFLADSVAFAGQQWVDRYFKVKENEKTTVFIMPDELGATPDNRDAYERANLWQLYTALAWGAERVRFIAFWDGQKSNKRGGTDHMIQAVRESSGRWYVVDSNKVLHEDQRRRA